MTQVACVAGARRGKGRGIRVKREEGEIRERNSCAQDLSDKSARFLLDFIWQPGVLQMSCICILIRGRNGENNRLAAGAPPPPPLALFSRIPLPFPLVAPAT